MLADRIVNSLRWLAETLSGKGETLRAGQIILAGSATSLMPVQPSSDIVVEAPPFGQVEARIDP